MKVACIAVRRPGNIDYAIPKRQAGSLLIGSGIEDQWIPATVDAGKARLDRRTPWRSWPVMRQTVYEILAAFQRHGK